MAQPSTFQVDNPADRRAHSVNTRDRATYDPNLSTAVNYTVASPADAPASLTYGPSFFALASRLQADEVTIGLNRRLANQSNDLAPGSKAKSTMSNLFAIELGNEPDCKYPSIIGMCMFLIAPFLSIYEQRPYCLWNWMEQLNRHFDGKVVDHCPVSHGQRV